MQQRCIKGLLIISLCLGSLLSTFAVSPAHAAGTATVTVSGTPLGVSTRFIGANTVDKNPAGFAGFAEAGFNHVRLWNDVSNYEPTDDDGVYGTPTIEQIKNDTDVANSGLIPWQVWDTNFSTWTDFYTYMKANNVRVMLSVRSTGLNHSKGWMVNQPPKTDADWNEYWQHVFAQTYWLNVRNDYHVDDFEIFNEPDLGEQGWNGDTVQYIEYIERTVDAITNVYNRFLPGRTPHFYVSSLSYPQVNGVNVPNGWQDYVLHWAGDLATDASYHNYSLRQGFIEGTAFSYSNLVNAQRTNYRHWVTEWGSYGENNPNCNSYLPCTVKLVENLVAASTAGPSYLYGSSYYLWARGSYGDQLFDQNGNPRLAFFAMRFGMRALQGGKTTFESTSSTPDLKTITTKDANGNLYALVINGSANNHTVDLNLSALYPGSAENTTLYRYDATHKDTSEVGPAVVDGAASIDVPSNGAIILKIDNTGSSSADTEAPTAPTDVNVTSYNESQVNLSWTGSTDNVKVDNYDIYVNGVSKYGVPNGTTSATIRNLKPGTEYTFVVKARDHAENTSESAPVKVTTSPQPAGKYEAEKGTFSEKATRNFSGYNNYSGLGYTDVFINAGDGVTFNVNVPSAGNYVVNAHYSNSTDRAQNVSIYANDTKIKSSVLTPVLDKQAWADKAEVFALRAGNNTITYKIDAGDGNTFRLDYIEVTREGTNKPAAPRLNTATVGNEEATLSWNAVPGATSYKISYGNATKVYNNTLMTRNVTSATVPNLVANIPYFFVVTALNRNGESIASVEKRVIPTDGPNPSKLKGVPFGSIQAESAFVTYHNALDGNGATFFAAPTGSYVGIDLGAGSESVVSQIRFRARDNGDWFRGRVVGGKFQGSNTGLANGWVDLYTIEQKANPDWNTVTVNHRYAYRYLRYVSPANAEMQIGDIEFYGPSYAKPTKVITPLLQCVLPLSGGDYLARFSYQSNNATPAVLPIGPYNKFSPGEMDQGQPYRFNPGLQENIFNVRFNGQPVTWTLNGKTVTADSASPVCAADTTPPARPTGFATLSTTVNSIGFAWNSTTDDVEVDYYSIKVNGTEVARVAGAPYASVMTYMLSDLFPDTAYSITVQAVDFSGNVSAAAGPLSVRTKLNWVVSASDGNGDVGRAIDRNMTTRWSSNRARVAGMWYQIDFTAAKTVSQIVLDSTGSNGDAIGGYQVITSDDGVNWSAPIATGTGTVITTINLATPVTTRYVRIVSTNQSNGAYWSIHELYVY